MNVTHCCREFSVRILAVEGVYSSHDDDLQVEGETAVVEVVEVIVDALRDRCIYAPAIHLSPSGDANFERIRSLQRALEEFLGLEQEFDCGGDVMSSSRLNHGEQPTLPLNPRRNAEVWSKPIIAGYAEVGERSTVGYELLADYLVAKILRYFCPRSIRSRIVQTRSARSVL